MGEQILGWIAVLIAVLWLLGATLGQWAGFRQSAPRWWGGARMTLVGELSGCVFIGSIGAVVLTQSPSWILPALLAWAVGYVSQFRAERRHQQAEEELRTRNMINFPGIFEAQPLEDLESVPGDELDLYDCGACTYLGRVPKSDVRTIFESFIPEQEPNDLFLIEESLELIPQDWLNPHTIDLLQSAFEHRDYLVLRWVISAEQNETG